jgi:hypothetical protein
LINYDKSKEELLNIQVVSRLLRHDNLKDFKLDGSYLVQMRGDPAGRLFNDKELPEHFLKLRQHIKVDYMYKCNPVLNTTKLAREMYKNLTRKKEEKKVIQRVSFKNFWKKYED